MATNKRVFTLRLSDEVFDKIGVLATREHRSMTNYIEYVLLKHINDIEAEQGEIKEENDRGRGRFCRYAASAAMPPARSLPPCYRHSRLTIVRRG